MQVRVFGEEPHTHAIAQQPETANERKEPELHHGIRKCALLKHPGNTKQTAGEEAAAKGDGRRMQIVHPSTAGQLDQQTHVHEGGETTHDSVAPKFTREGPLASERRGCPRLGHSKGLETLVG